MDTAVRSRPVVYQFDSDLERLKELSDRAPLIEFLRVHGLGYRFIIGTALHVREHEDGSLWVHTRRAVGEAPHDGQPSTLERCPHCSGCVKTKPYETPLVSPPPYLDQAYVKSGYHDALARVGT